MQAQGEDCLKRLFSPGTRGPKKRLRGEVLVPRVATADQRGEALGRVRDVSPTGHGSPRALVDEGNDEAGNGTEKVTYFCTWVYL